MSARDTIRCPCRPYLHRPCPTPSSPQQPGPRPQRRPARTSSRSSSPASSAPPSSGTTSSSTAPPPPSSSATLFFPESEPVDRHAARLRHLRARLRRAPARRGRVRPLRRPGRTQEDARRLAADDGRRAPSRSACCRRTPAIGVAAPILLLVCRLVQGFAVGGEWGGAVLMAAEHGDDEHRGFWSSLAAGRRAARQPARDRRALACSPPSSPTRRSRPGAGASRSCSPRCWCSSASGSGSSSRSRRSSRRPRPRSRPRAGDSHLPILEVIKRYPKEVLHRHGHADGGEHLATTSSPSSSSPTSRPTSTPRRASILQSAADRRGVPVRR